MSFFQENIVKIIVSVVLMISAIALGLFVYNKSVRSDLYKSACSTLTEVIEQQKFNFSTRILSDVDSIKSLAQTAPFWPNHREETVKIAREMVGYTQFDYIIIANTDGYGITSDDDVVDISQRPFYQSVLNGETVINAPIPSLVNDNIVIPIATPISQNGRTKGLMVGAYAANKLASLILPFYEGEGFAYITKVNGDLIVSPENPNAILVNRYNVSNLFDGLTQAECLRYDDYETILENVRQGKSGNAVFDIDGYIELMRYAPVGINDWYIFMVVPEAAVTSEVASITKKTIVMSVLILTLFSAVMLYIVIMQRNAAHMQAIHTKKLERIAYEDELTGAPTLAKFKLEAQKYIDDSPGKKLLMVRFDIEQFKLVNQTLGYEMGNKVILSLANALKINTPGEYERYARLRDDEFLVLHEYESIQEVMEIRRRFQRIFLEQMGSGFDYEIKIISGHYYMEIEHCTDVSEAIEKASAAHSKAKQTGQEVCVYDEVFIQQALKEKELENRMRAALASNEFKVYLQPKYRLCDKTIGGAEALVRWHTPRQEIVSPGSFIPVFERNGFITQLDIYVFEQVCNLLRNWMSSGIQPITISVNFSRQHLSDSTFASKLCEIADSIGVPRNLLEIEITEAAVLGNEELFFQTLETLHSKGFPLSMDDFGTGYSSLGLLTKLPLDVIKLDRSFFVHADTEERTRSVVSCIVEMTKKLGIHTVAEGVETKEQVALLEGLGCDMVQGFYYAKPMPAEDLLHSLSISQGKYFSAQANPPQSLERSEAEGFN